MKKVYIAGKITGDPNFKTKFDQAKEWLSGYGQSVMSPADLPAGMKQGDYMRICLAMIDSADEVHVLPGSKDSKGTKIEVLYAQYIGKEVVLMGDEMYPDHATDIMREAVE